MKESNRKFDEFAHNLIAESLKKWSKESQFVQDKLKQRLENCVDELDQRIAGVIFQKESQGSIGFGESKSK